MDLEPSLTAQLDQLTAALRDAPQGLLVDLDSSVRAFALHMRACGIEFSSLHGFLHGCVADSVLRFEAEMGLRRGDH